MDTLSGGESVQSRMVLTVTELTMRIKDVLEGGVGSVWVTGEISNLRRPLSGHVYLTLKDGGSAIPAVMFSRVARGLRFEPADGQEVTVFGTVSVYVPRGAYQIIIEQLEPKGIGALQIAFEQLKRKLEAEGLFDASRKRPLPFLPRRIGVVTSPTGAAISDIISVILRRFPKPRISLMPVRVQGAEAAAEIAGAIRKFNEKFDDVDVLIVGRGGGSLEDLWPFNEETVARAIAASRIPVISAVGHEIDFTIADFAADRRALTPSEAGEIVLPKLDDLLDRLGGFWERLAKALRMRVSETRKRVEFLFDRLSPSIAGREIAERIQLVDDLSERLSSAAGKAVSERRRRIESLCQVLGSLSPSNVLGRGYSFTTRESGGPALRDAREAVPGMRIRTHLEKGTVVSKVEEAGESGPP